jgi:proteasome lid subunit RPN8/RPN11
MSDRPHCLWESPDGQTAIYLAFDAVDAINAAIAEAAAEIPLRGAEIGGLLIGKAEKRARLTVWVDHVELLPSCYSRGPSYLLDEDAAVDRERTDIAGFFRSHTRKDLFLSSDDQSLILKYFNRPEQVVLLVKPFQTRANLGGFFISKDGKIPGSESAREFPFNRRELGGGESPASVSKPNTPTRNRQEPEIRQEFEGSNSCTPPESKRPILLWAMMAFLAFAAATSVSYLLFSRTKSSLAPAHVVPSALRLTASEGDHNVALSWDRESPMIASATRGVVEIQEGTFSKKIELGPEQLRSGKIIYSRPVAISDTVAFSLKVYPEGGRTIVESLQFISNAPIAAGLEQSAAQTQTKSNVDLPPPAVGVAKPQPSALPSPSDVPITNQVPSSVAPISSSASAPEAVSRNPTPELKAPSVNVDDAKPEAAKTDPPKTDQPPPLTRPVPRRIP